MTEDKKPQSKFNYALAFLESIHFMFIDCMKARADCDPHNWSVSLLNLYTSLVTDIPKEEQQTKYDEVIQILNECKMLQQKSDRMETPVSIPSSLYKRMTDYEIWLRKIVDNAGYQSKREKEFSEPEEQW